ncbi:unnamed protein product [Pleuronectes platessa]|uniref:Cadherin domain-containing protein n=1 Tax=Pleuronectes platessa TaxID=8262 RepID=A0A9N7VE62_PLEPL|nr:unnamed protein product [Pleuronectes platessa]
MKLGVHLLLSAPPAIAFPPPSPPVRVFQLSHARLSIDLLYGGEVLLNHVSTGLTSSLCRGYHINLPLDYESKKAYTFKVDATNAHLDPRFQSFGAFKDTATVKINVLDVDEPPVFNKPSYVMDVHEDTPAGTIIGAVTAQDLDASSSPVRYSIDWKSDMDSYFDIDPVEGTISTNEQLDRETIAQHNISIVATKLNSPVLTSRVAVTVHVLDINEFPPELSSPYETFVCENAKMGQGILFKYREVSEARSDIVGLMEPGRRADELPSCTWGIRGGDQVCRRSSPARGEEQTGVTAGPERQIQKKLKEPFGEMEGSLKGRQQSGAEAAESAVCAERREVIQTFGAKDQDLPMSGQHFSFKSPKEDFKSNKNFTIRDFGRKCARFHQRNKLGWTGVRKARCNPAEPGRFNPTRSLSPSYALSTSIPLAIHSPEAVSPNNGYPPKSSTGTLTIRVCGCESDGSLLTCSAEAIFLPVGLSTGALIAILLCIIILLETQRCFQSSESTLTRGRGRHTVPGKESGAEQQGLTPGTFA